MSVELDFAAVFESLPTAYLLMSPDLVIREANAAYLHLLGRERDDLVGRYVFDAFPPASSALDEAGSNPLQQSFEQARDTGLPHQLPLFRYDVYDPVTGTDAQRVWSLISAPVPDVAGGSAWVLQRVEDVTRFVAEREQAITGGRTTWQRIDQLEADLFGRTHELRSALAAREAATTRLAALAEVTLQLSAATTVDDVAHIVTGTGLTALGADGGALAMRDDDAGVLRLSLSPSLGEPAQREFRQVPLSSTAPAAWVVEHDQPLALGTRADGLAWSPGMATTYDLTGQLAWLAVPLRSGGRVLGALVASWRRERQLTPDEVETAQAFATQCAQALTRVHDLQAERRRAASSRAVAEILQRSLLTEPPEPDHAEVVVRYLPSSHAAQVGGDWYDAFFQPGGTTMLVIGDVAGHDTDAAATMGQLRGLLRGIATYSDAGPAEVLRGLDSSMQLLGITSLVTAAVARFEQDADEVERGVTRMVWANAGHPPPVVVDPDGTVRTLTAARADLLLGVDAVSVRHEHVTLLARDATVLLHTDGLVERRDQDLDAGTDRLLQVLADHAREDLADLVDSVLGRMVDGHPDDDIALVAVRLHPQDRPRPPEAGPNRVPDGLPPAPDPRA
ncbi:Serine phosphatase RsbU, regulator of sigma subunit [Klenkia marina]|uniref:Serine phosphatase RsbU, regulator of sigma subunit n=1 Tax=Klenkia marina TaxID=1960309 RepID=A0A1G4YL89_9ACTN|nr:SpoIIE family protein phosphatase [Klenkia marina]SCX54246.1 Serine phosphatase RsbU, regulator of sigma subunit [Klenkia marina]